MDKNSATSFDVLVVGAGPAGIAAAARAAEYGLRVGVVDDNVAPGGQIWRGSTHEQSTKAKVWSDRLRASGASTLFGMRVFDQPSPNVLLAEQESGVAELHYGKLILATGARERFLPFPGWTLPNVMGAGGLQALVKSGLPIEGKRVVVAGTGPLLLAVAAYLRKKGAKVRMICEQSSWNRLASFGVGLLRFPGKISQAVVLRKDLSGIPIATNSWVVQADGSLKLESVTISRSGKRERVACDYLACGFHLVPNIELPMLLGCEIRDGNVKVDEFQQTSISNMFCAGEPVGIGGVDAALVEGQIAGFAACGRTKEARSLFSARRKARRFASALERAFRLRAELKQLPTLDTLVCRCEDVAYARLQQHDSWRAAKLHTRCGMGPCQGRVCGPATEFLLNWNPESVRPPVFPVRVESLASTTAIR